MHPSNQEVAFSSFPRTLYFNRAKMIIYLFTYIQIRQYSCNPSKESSHEPSDLLWSNAQPSSHPAIQPSSHSNPATVLRSFCLRSSFRWSTLSTSLNTITFRQLLKSGGCSCIVWLWGLILPIMIGLFRLEGQNLARVLSLLLARELLSRNQLVYLFSMASGCTHYRMT